ncbi:unnamed protein product [Calicophoron daubneyi]|uniref:Hydroxymethylglutaryl-CoA synthase n=1 Tax=Calicophoron daubneyi TaxID=300641 RepID=A0AAV2TIJ6_CALDB
MRANDVGILALEVYFPRYYVAQSDLEVADECVGKYTKGLGQQALGVCTLQEDISSISLTVVNNLVNRLNLDLRNVGFLEVGTETMIDKSKSTKTILMRLFKECGNLDVEGADVKNACFGGTAALFHAIDWIESSAWDGRLALVVAGDIAIYGSKAARPTGGAGAVAILLGPEAPLVFDPGLRAHHARDQYDFYKPDMSSEYPMVDGKLSMRCYQESLLSCYRTYKRKATVRGQFDVTVLSSPPFRDPNAPPAISQTIDYMCFHAPFSRLVQKAFGWLALEDVKSQTDPSANTGTKAATNASAENSICTSSLGDEVEIQAKRPSQTIDPIIFSALKGLCDNNTSHSPISDRDLEASCVQASKDLFAAKVEPGLVFAKHIGNMYTASLYACLISLLLSVPLRDLRGRRIMMYSYGSGLLAAMFSLYVHPTRSVTNLLQSMCTSHARDNPIFKRLFESRTRLSIPQFEEILEERRKLHNTAPCTPSEHPDGLFPGSYYLVHVDERYQRTYEKMPTAV